MPFNCPFKKNISHLMGGRKCNENELDGLFLDERVPLPHLKTLNPKSTSLLPQIKEVESSFD